MKSKSIATRAIIVIASLLCVAMLILWFAVFRSPFYYSAALDQMNDGNYADAAIRFAALGDYQDSKKYTENCLRKTIEYAQVGDAILFGTNNNITLTWKVIKADKTGRLLLCTSSVADKPYNSESGGIDPSSQSYNYNLWTNCSLRTWLNTVFYEDAFSELEKQMITQTKVHNNYSMEYTKSGGADTSDYLFVLSPNEYQDLKESGIHLSNCWLRGPAGTNGMYACSTYGDDRITAFKGVAPAMWIDFESNTRTYSMSSASDTGRSENTEKSISRKTCPHCDGKGKFYGQAYDDWGEAHYFHYTCSKCNGTGYVYS